MSEPRPSHDTGIKPGEAPAAAPPPDAPVVYQPISGWAIAGLTASLSFTGLVVISAFVAFYQGAPFFLPIWMMAVAILAIALSLIGLRHVQNSEGTRTGANLARWGFRLSLLSGLLYFSYYFVTGFAVQSQANAFVMEMKDDDSGFIPRLRAGATNRAQHNAAFLLTQSPNARSARPENEKNMRLVYDKPNKEGGSGLLTTFREKELLPRLLGRDLGKDVEITPGSVLDWKYEKRSYKIYRAYHIRTPELEMDYVIAVFSVEAEAAGQGRKWFVNLTESGPPRQAMAKLTPLGQGMIQVRKSANAWLGLRFKAVHEGVAFLDAEKLDKTPWQSDVLNIEDRKWQERRAQLHNALAGKGDLKMELGPFGGLMSQPEIAGGWEQDKDGRLRTFPMYRFVLKKPGEQFPIYMFEVIATLESKQPLDPAKLPDDATIDWELLGIEATAVHVLLKKEGPM